MKQATTHVMLIILIRTSDILKGVLWCSESLQSTPNQSKKPLPCYMLHAPTGLL
jgi:hypothetical protein